MRIINDSRWTFTLLTLGLAGCLICGFGCSKKASEAKAGSDADIHWLTSLDEAVALAEKQNKPIMIDFMAEWCPPCKKMEKTTFNQPDVIEKAKSFVTLRIDVDEQAEVANKYHCNAEKYGGIGIPNILFMTHKEKRLKHIIGYQAPESLVAVMDSVLTMME